MCWYNECEDMEILIQIHSQPLDCEHFVHTKSMTHDNKIVNPFKVMGKERQVIV